MLWCPHQGCHYDILLNIRPHKQRVWTFLHKAYLSKNLHMYFRRFTLFFPVLCLLKEQKVKRCTIIVPIVHPRPVWWSLLVDYCESYLMLGEKGDKTILLIQSKKGYISDKIGLKWELRACRMNFDWNYSNNEILFVDVKLWTWPSCYWRRLHKLQYNEENKKSAKKTN